MHFNDHPPPHFHAKYAEFKAAIEIDTLAVSDGYMPPRTYGLVIEWAAIHENELRAAWNRISRHENTQQDFAIGVTNPNFLDHFVEGCQFKP